jgi:hypothetical protein
MSPRVATYFASGTIISLVIAALGYGWMAAFISAVGNSPSDAHRQSPVITVEPAFHDLGKLTAGPPVETAFRVTNGGARRLILQKQSNSCGCLSADPEINVPPGHTRRIAASLHTAHLRGPVQIEITYRTNDPHCQKLKLTLLADVVADGAATDDDQPLLPTPLDPAGVTSQASSTGK